MVARSRFSEAASIRRLGAIEYVACRDKAGERRVLVTGAPGADKAETAALLVEIARVHRLIDDPRVPRVAEVDHATEPTYVALSCDAVVDFETLTLIATENTGLIEHGGATSFAFALMETLERAHAIKDPETGAPLCLGALATVNVLASEDGTYWFLGWGHPAQGPPRAKLLSEIPQSHMAPETAFGAPVLPGSDLTAATLFFHSFYRLGEFPKEVVATMAQPLSTPGPLGELVVALMRNAHAPRPEDRSIPRFLEDLRKTLEVLRIKPDAGVFARDLVKVIGLWRARSVHGSPLVVERSGRWCAPPGGPMIQLERRGAMRRIVLELAKARSETPGEPISWERLFECGWPRERPNVEAARNRLYVAVANLRSMGFRDILVRNDAGYLLDPAVPLTWSDAPHPPEE